MNERFLITGAGGCLGAWTIARLLSEGVEVVAFDVSDDRRRLDLVVDESSDAQLHWAQGDIRDSEQLSALVRSKGITHIVHLAALQVPFCKADPLLGSQVNVSGTINVLEAVRHADGVVRGLAYASSVAVFGTPADYPGGIAGDGDRQLPASLYGVYKQANEAAARVYYVDWQVPSVGLRPCIVYGPGRDQGLTSGPTVAMLRAAGGLSSHIGFGGRSTFHHADDVAAAMIAAARLHLDGAEVFNVGGADATVADVASAIEHAAPDVTVTFDDVELALPAGVDGRGLSEVLGESVAFRTLEAGVSDTVDRFRGLVASGRLSVD
jgi:nucleoside-diphosphate-sugar epimerase